jgi:alpha-1,3-mannosyltransferase
MSPKIIHVVRQFFPAVGGLENFVRSLALEQKKMGYDVHVITLNRIFHQDSGLLPEHGEIDGISIERINYFGSYKYPLAFSILGKLKIADIVHVHGVDFFSDYLSLTRFIHRKKLVLSTHGGFFHTGSTSRLKKLFFNTVTRFTIKNYASVYACSNNDYDTFLPIAQSNLTLIENGVDINKFFDAASLTTNKTLVFIGRFSDNKRIDKLVSFISQLVQLDPDYKLLVIGKDWDGNYLNLKAQVQSLSLNDYVDIFTGLSDAEIKDKVGQACFVVSASEYEGFGLSLIEGMSAGLIPLASPIKSFEKIIADAGLGLINDFSTNEGNVLKVHNYITNVTSDYTSNRANVISASQKYCWSSKSREFSNIYDSILGIRQRNIQGVNIDARNAEEVIEHLDNLILNKTQQAVAFANAHTINQANSSADFKPLLRDFLILNDGVGVEIASKLKFGKGFENNLNGTDFLPKYLAESQHKLRIYLLGSTSEIVNITMDAWGELYPQHEWLGCHHGFIEDHKLSGVLVDIKSLQPTVLIVAMGNPKQEFWISKNMAETNTTLSFGVGALFDFTAGEVKRAPDWLQKIKLEWLYRFLQEPNRLWKRYIIGNFIFMFRALKD